MVRQKTRQNTVFFDGLFAVKYRINHNREFSGVQTGKKEGRISTQPDKKNSHSCIVVAVTAVPHRPERIGIRFPKHSLCILSPLESVSYEAL